MRILILATLLFPAAALAECDLTLTQPLVEGNPVVKVAPMYPRAALRKGIENCVVVGYNLEVVPGSGGRGLRVDEIEVLSVGRQHSRSFSNAAQKALRKWLFLKSTHSTSSEIAYFSKIPFQLEEPDAE